MHNHKQRNLPTPIPNPNPESERIHSANSPSRKHPFPDVFSHKESPKRHSHQPRNRHRNPRRRVPGPSGLARRRGGRRTLRLRRGRAITIATASLSLSGSSSRREAARLGRSRGAHRRGERGPGAAAAAAAAGRLVRGNLPAKDAGRGHRGVARVAGQRGVGVEAEGAGGVDDGHHAVLAMLAGVLGAVDGLGVGVGDGDAEDLGLVVRLALWESVLGEKGGVYVGDACCGREET